MDSIILYVKKKHAVSHLTALLVRFDFKFWLLLRAAFVALLFCLNIYYACFFFMKFGGENH